MVAVEKTALSPGELVARWTAFLEEGGFRDATVALAERYPESRSLEVPFTALDGHDAELADALLSRPEAVLEAGQQALLDFLPDSLRPPQPLRLRITHLPVSQRIAIHELRETHLNRFLALEGIVRRVTEVRPQVVDAVFECAACRSHIHEPQEAGNPLFREPLECEKEQGGCGKPAGRTRFTLVPNESRYIDSQRLELQENPEKIKGGSHPEGMTTILTEDLTGHIIPGNRMVINGVLKSVQRATAGRGGLLRSTVFDLVLLANSLEPEDREYVEIALSDEERGQITALRGQPKIIERIVDSLAPSIQGMRVEKEAIALELFGGVPKEQPDGIHIRGDIHILIVGDPGLAKSQLLRYVADIAPRGIYTSGKGATAAGLTAAAVKDDFGGGRWTLEAGAMVLADGGMLCVHPEATVMSDGLAVPIGSLFEEESAVKGRTKNGETVEVSPLRTSTVSLDLKQLSTTAPSTTLVARRPYRGPLVRITLASGFVSRVTPNHLVMRGSDLKWVPASALATSDRILTVQKLPPRQTPVYILEILPDDWIVQPSREEKRELRRRLQSTGASLTSINQAYGLKRGALNGRDAIPLSTFRRIIRDLGIYDEWKAKPLPYGRRYKPTRIRVAELTPDLCYLLGFIFGDGHVPTSSRRTELHITQSPVHGAYISRFQGASRRSVGRCWTVTGHWIPSKLHGRNGRTFLQQFHLGSAVLYGTYQWLKADGMRNILALPDESLRAFMAGAFDADGCLSTRKSGDYTHTLACLMLSKDPQVTRNLMLALRRLDIYSRASPAGPNGGVTKIEVTSGVDIQRLIQALQPYSAKVHDVPPRKEQHPGKHEEVPGPQLARLLKASRVRPTDLLEDGVWSAFYNLRAGKATPFKGTVEKLAPHILPSLDAEKRQELEGLLTRDYALDTIVDVAVEPYEGFVYDLRVPDGESFLCDGMVVHNCVDELDKMSPSDRSSMHEALEQGTVSVAKAGITATLRARCPVLAAANPKLGRFTPDKLPAEQIDLPPTLLSRFDVIFAIQDKPDRDRDRSLAGAILNVHQKAEAREASRGGGASPEVFSSMEGPFPPAFLRKYIAYARQNVFPVMDPEAHERLLSFFVELRKQGEGEHKPVPITLRQVEGLVRLTEAAARARLAPVATIEDAERAIAIIEHFLKTVVAAEGGRLDIDVIAAGVSSSHRDQVSIVEGIMRELQAGTPGGFTLKEVGEAAEKLGLSRDRVDKIVQELSRMGSVYTPRPGLYRLPL